MTDRTLQFRPSACGRFVVALIGAARPHVLPLDEAEAMVGVYVKEGRAALARGEQARAGFEHATAHALQLAVGEAKGRS